MDSYTHNTKRGVYLMSSDDPFSENIVRMGKEKAERYTIQLKRQIQGSKTEEDVRLGTYVFLKDLAKEMSVRALIQNEKVVLSGGRIDSLFDNIVFEFKNPNHFDTKSGIIEAVEGRKGKIEGQRKGGLIEYLISLAVNESNDIEEFKDHLSTKLGVGFDGKSFIFLRYVKSADALEVDISQYKTRLKGNCPEWLTDNVDGTFERSDNNEIKNGLRFLFLYLRAISVRAPLTPENVSMRFGEESKNFSKHLQLIYSTLAGKLNEKDEHTTTLYEEWDRVFGKVYGDLNTATKEVKEGIVGKYKESIDFSGFKEIDLKLLIFSIHTYYNIILKFLVSILFSSLLNPFTTHKTILSQTDEKFKSYIISIVQGERFDFLGIKNFFETGFFEWWTFVWDSQISEMLREVIASLEELEVTTSITKPELIGDMVKHTYHSLMPQGLRHLLGEYFTPDWLADYTIQISGYSGKLEETFLDPACGSGTFLISAIKKKISTNSKTNRAEVIKNILNSIIGFDLNPISVIASKTNYLLSLGDISDLEFEIKIPVYQCDSILTPAVHASQRKNEPIFTIDTVCGRFIVPALDSREKIEDILDTIKLGIKNNFSDKQLVDKVKIKYKDIDYKIIIDLFEKIKTLTKLNRNGLWIPILKNSFAPVYSENQFNFVIGNPPWVSWRNMSKSYRELTLPIWWGYDIFNKSAYDRGTTHDDFAMAFTYVSADHYLKMNGKLCFVISQAFFKSKKGGEGFRKFRITREGLDIPLKVHEVVDMVKVKPFEEVTNRTSVMLIEKGEQTIYPVQYHKWEPKQKVRESDPLMEVKKKITETMLVATPIGGISNEKGLRSPWLTLLPDEMKRLSKAIGVSPYRGRKGVEPLGAKGVYLLKEPVAMKGNTLQICNILERGRLKEVEELGEHIGRIEADFVYPLISGRNIDRYGLNSYTYVLLPHENKKGTHNAISEDTLKVKYTATYEWLSYFKKILFETRKRNGKFFDEKIDPFYALDNVGTYTFAPFKVVWKEQDKQMIACVISTKASEPLKKKLIIPDSKVLFCPLESEDEAHYLCAVLNSKPVTDLIEGYTLELQRGTDILENVKVPKFNDKDILHKQLSELSKEAHIAYINKEDRPAIQQKIDTITFRLF
ncbi:N-6 DNA methylase [Candidatus Marsarchaeota archaeon]|nr:N-6 DNA methylase [Candidatus Marsarchaeota archaeon]